ncbi:RNA-directed DNA polymerase from mobile element jockey [Takifugu flavidus]|uniref:RNA-directed DNA polymerase from mobile element jockey n=1 Tax=Takifugu flavidus TaxID=433684 RepID=A0A5C6MFD3_9TELE|nr:RNA-directed DNA polymerase from mobile element jockey [Takifugu flavidus]
MQDSWWDRKAEEVQNHAESNNAKEFYSSLKAVYGPAKPSITPLLSADGSTLLKDKANIIERWREHFSTLLNRPSTVDPAALNSIPQKPVVDDLDLPPSLDEVMKAIKQTSSGKAAGGDNIPAELHKAAGPGALGAFHNILTSIWEEENMPQDFKDATVVSIFKKGNKADCGNYRGISLLSIAGKILARVILNRLISLVSEEALPETQCGFRPGRSTIDMVFTIRQIQEKCIEQHKDLFAVFIDLTKAFDTVNREALWSVLSKLGCPRKFTNLIRLFHDGMQGLVLSNGDTSAPFDISNGVKQGCVLAPVLFNLFFTCVLNHALRDLDRGIYLRYGWMAPSLTSED